jgi:hypothetical protein
MCISLSNFLDRDFYFDCEIPSSTPPEYASQPEFKDKFSILLESPRSLVSQLMDIPNRRVPEIDRSVKNKAEFQLLYSHFATTDEVKKRFENTVVWDSFAVGRICMTREELADKTLIEWTHTKLSNPSIFYFLGREEKRALLDSVRIRYLPSIEALALRIGGQIGPHHAVHLRQGDYFDNYGSDGYQVNVGRFREYDKTDFTGDGVPVLVATDGLQEKETLERIFDGYEIVFIDELIFDEFKREYRELEFTDFNALTILNQLICASAGSFIGTYRSTFTSVIHRIRQGRYRKRDFCFSPTTGSPGYWTQTLGSCLTAMVFLTGTDTRCFPRITTRCRGCANGTTISRPSTSELSSRKIRAAHCLVVFKNSSREGVRSFPSAG